MSIRGKIYEERPVANIKLAKAREHRLERLYNSGYISSIVFDSAWHQLAKYLLLPLIVKTCERLVVLS